MISSPDPVVPFVFTAHGFLDEMRRRGGGAGEAAALTASGSLLVARVLDEYPDPALAWITGIYALAMRRRPAPAVLRKHLQSLRDGASPADVLDEVLTSPEAAASRPQKRPDLAETYVTGVYLVALSRVPDQPGLAAHVAALARGMTEAQLLKHLLGTGEAQSQFRYPPPRIDVVDVLARTVQSVGVGEEPTLETTQWAQEALSRGVSPQQVVRSLARRLYGLSPRGVLVALTARRRGADARRSADLAVLHEELLRERVWHWEVQRATWQRLDRLEAIAATGRPSPVVDDADYEWAPPT
jgi:hypothetical protein